MNLAEEFKAIVGALNAAGIPYAVCGGFAVIIHGFPRVTQDIDLLVRGEDVDRLKTTLSPLGFRLDSGSIIFNPGEASETRVHRLVKVAGEAFLVLDMLVAAERYEDALTNCVQMVWAERSVNVVDRAGLQRLKVDAGRPKDFEDLRRLGLEAN